MKNFLILSFVFIMCTIGTGLNDVWGQIPGKWLFDQNENKVDDRIERLARERPDSLIGMIIDLRHRPTEDDSIWLSNFNEVKYVGRYINSIILRPAPPGMSFEIASSLDVVMVELDAKVYSHLDVSARAIRAKASSMYSPNTAWEAGFKGKGVNIAILDTGVDDKHPSLDDMDDNAGTTDPKFIAGYDATATPRVATNPDDNNTHYWNGYTYVKGDVFHGTHVAGIALGTGGGTDNSGIAPKAKLIDVKVLDYGGTGYTSDVIAGIEWCIKNRNTAWSGQSSDHYGIDILNLSLGAGISSGQDAMSRAVNKAVSMGLVVVAAAGNQGQSNYIISPAAADGAIAVGSVNDQGTINRSDDIISSHSSWGSNKGPRHSDGDSDLMDELKPDVTAYGSFIQSAKGINPGQIGSGYQDLGGTSQATPHVAGVCALILESHPSFLPHDVKNLLRATAEDRNGTYNPSLDPHYDVSFGWGIVNAYAAVTTTGAPPDLWISWLPAWHSKDIWLAKPAKVGDPNTVYARIHNNSGTPASGVKIEFHFGIFGTAPAKWLLTKNTTINVPATGSVIASVPWTPTSGFMVTGMHPCVKVEIKYPPDPNISNNWAQRNLSIQKAAGAGMFTFRAWNPFDAHKKIFFGLDKSQLFFDDRMKFDAMLEPDGVFELEYGDSLDLSVEIWPLDSAPGDTGIVHVKEFVQGTITPIGGASFAVVSEPPAFLMTLPDTTGSFRDTLFIPIKVSSELNIGLAQAVVEYDRTRVEFIGARQGADAPGFSLMVQPNPPFPVTTPDETNKNILVQISGGGSKFFSGQNKEAILVGFKVIDSVIGNWTPLIFDRTPSRSFLTTEHLQDIFSPDLFFVDGSFHVRESAWPLILRVIYAESDPPRPVSGVGATVSSNAGAKHDTTGNDGVSMFSDVPEGEVSLFLSKTGDHRNAHSGADALLVLRYLAFFEELNEAQQKAADVTLDDRVAGSDAMAILRKLAFFDTGIAHVGEWSFDPDDWCGTPPKPFPWPPPGPMPPEPLEARTYLLGDVNLSWGANMSGNLSKAMVSQASLSLGEVDGISGEQVLIPVAIQTNGETANTVVFTVKYDPSCLEYQSTLKAQMADNFTMVANGTEAGKIHIAMADVSGLNESGDMLHLAFKVKEKTSGSNTELSLSRAFVNDLEVMNHANSQICLAESGMEMPKTFQLAQNFPNPFNAETVIRYGIPDTKGQRVSVTINIYNVNGQLVRTLVDKQKAPGYHSVTWDGMDNEHQPVASGIYFYQIRSAEFSSIKKMSMLK